MKKISTASGKGDEECFSTEVNHRFGSGRSFELVLPAGRSWRGAAGTETGHDSKGDAGGVRSDAALSDRAGDRDALAVGEPVTERVGA